MWRTGSIATVVAAWMLLGLVGSAFADGPQPTLDRSTMAAGQITVRGDGFASPTIAVVRDSVEQPAQNREGASSVPPNQVNRAHKEQIGWLLFAALVVIGISLPIAVSRAVKHASPLQSTAATRWGAQQTQIASEPVKLRDALPSDVVAV